MCSKTEAREAHAVRNAAIDRFSAMVEAMPMQPAATTTDTPMTRAIGAIARIYESAAATVALPGQRSAPGKGRVKP